MPESLLAFAPVPSASSRHDGWTPERQRQFIANLARIGLVSAAAKAVGMSAKSAYRLLKRAGGDSEFAAAWRHAIRVARVRTLDACIDRALNGVETPVFRGGRQVGTRKTYNDRLLIAAMRALTPKKYDSQPLWGEADMEDW